MSHAQAIDANAVTSDELNDCEGWCEAKFLGRRSRRYQYPHLAVFANQWGPIRKNRNAFGATLNIAGREYQAGLNCHAFSQIGVRLPSPARCFTAVIGVDSNHETRPGLGNVVFAIKANQQELYRSPVLREGMAGIAIEIPLCGSDEFLMEASDGGLGTGYCQANWAEARVELEDGTIYKLDEIAHAVGIPKGMPSIEPPFSFVYGGKRSADLLPRWSMDSQTRELDRNRIEHTLCWNDSVTGLQVRCYAIQYRDYPIVEWTVYFTNHSTKISPILENVYALDSRFERNPSGEFVLHHAIGSPCSPGDYGPLQTVLTPLFQKSIRTSGGRGSNSNWPYFNIEAGEEGQIIVVGWPGQWAANFTRDNSNGLNIQAGQEGIHCSLLPGEEIRTPLMVVQFWKSGDRIRSQNIWRRWMLDHSLPRPDGQLPKPMLFGCTSRLYEEMAKANVDNQLMCLERYREEQLVLDGWWMDAGWYPIRSSWVDVGNWEVDKSRFPDGFMPISEYAHRLGIKILVWFEPERVAPNTWLADHHPEWIIGGKQGGLFDLGNPDARRWMIEHIDSIITEQGIDIYRQDFNIDPLPFWEKNDLPDRRGITENKHVCGYLAYWDQLRQRHPSLLIDSCASGGRRNDLESMRRAVPLWRTDYPYNAVATQSQTYGISLWIPYHGTGTVAASNVPYLGAGYTPHEPYAFWSNVTPSVVCGFDIRERTLNYNGIRRLIQQWRKISSCYYGDYYPLTPYTLDEDTWMAWQFNHHVSGTGMVQCFRRSTSPYVSARFKLHALDPSAYYRVTLLSTETEAICFGRDLLEKGWEVQLEESPSFAVMHYCRVI